MSPSIVDEIYLVEKKFIVYYLFKNFRSKILKKKMPSRKHTLKEREKNLNYDASKSRKITDTFFRETTATE